MHAGAKGCRGLGINYGTVADDLPSASRSVQLLRAAGAGAVKIYDANADILRALAGSPGRVCRSRSWCRTLPSRRWPPPAPPRRPGWPPTSRRTSRRRGWRTCSWATRCSPTAPSRRPRGAASCRRWRTSAAPSARAGSAGSSSGRRSPWTRCRRRTRRQPARSAATSPRTWSGRCSGS